MDILIQKNIGKIQHQFPKKKTKKPLRKLGTEMNFLKHYDKGNL